MLQNWLAGAEEFDGLARTGKGGKAMLEPRYGSTTITIGTNSGTATAATAGPGNLKYKIVKGIQISFCNSFQ